MPVQSWAHAQYWRARANPVVAPPPSRGGYPAWQAAVIASLFGVFQGAWERIVRAWHWARYGWTQTGPPDQDGILSLWQGLATDQRTALRAAFEVVQSPAWTRAQAAVADTARAEGFNRKQAWAAVGGALRGETGTAENTWRHLRALQSLREAGVALSGPTLHLLIELAYHEYARSDRGRRVNGHLV